jgi:hypothetical protein
LRPYAPWNNCNRCDRASYRWGIFAPSTKTAKVLVLSAAASRASQCIGKPDPLPALVADVIRATYALNAKDIHIDTLLACGASGDAHAHEAAACAQRIEDQVVVGGWPVALVVLVGDHAARLARYAGLLTASGFQLGGKSRPCAVVREPSEVGATASWSVLGRPPMKSGAPRLYPSARSTLQRLVAGRCTGHAWRPVGGEWRRSYDRPPPELVDAHVDGKGWLSPYRPIGPWPYCVIDVDLHNAVQHANFDETIKKLNTLFKTSLFFQSSPTGGGHIYVALPDGTTYADAAVWLTEFLFLHDLLFVTVSPEPSATLRGRVATRLVDVPLHPPRLPFGSGSALRGFPDPKKAVGRFDVWLAAQNSADFDAARNFVQQRRGNTTRWTRRARWARIYVHDLELEALGSNTTTVKKKVLAAGDPWQPYVPRLAPSVAVLATNGCLAFGTRTGTMTRLADALAEMAEPDTAKELLRFWVEHREHRSEDIHVAREDVLAFADRLIDEAFSGRGLPNSIWTLAVAEVRKTYARIGAHHAVPLGLSEEECRRAAFHILQLFYEVGHGNIVIAAEQFGLALRHNNIGGLPVRRPNQDRVEVVRRAMKRLFLTQTRAPDHTRGIAGEYELDAPYWPPPSSGGPVTYQAT